MEFVQGRDNLACTIYVPWDCNNNCEFCTSKKEYKNFDLNFMSIQNILHTVDNSFVPEVVITGGEPSKNIQGLSTILSAITRKKVYINTTLLRENDIAFIELINSSDNVDGVNISRHAYREDLDILFFNNGVCHDYMIGYLKPKVHINVVAPDNETLEYYIRRYRWVAEIRKSCGFGSLTICIRADFRKINQDSLHNIDDEMLKSIGNLGYKLLKHTYCNVCDTYDFEIEDGFYISYHRGLENTSIEYGDTIEVNDIVVFPDGTICYDWDKSKECGEKIFDEMKYKINPANFILPKPKYPFPQYMPPCGCSLNIGSDYKDYKGCGSGGC